MKKSHDSHPAETKDPRTRFLNRLGRAIEMKNIAGSSDNLIHISNALINTKAKNGEIRGQRYIGDVTTMLPLATRQMDDDRDNAVLGVVIAGDSASAIVARRSSLSNGELQTDKLSLVQLPYGSFRSDPDRNASPRRLLANVNVNTLRAHAEATGKSQSYAFGVGSAISGLEGTENLAELHYNFLVSSDGTFSVIDKETTIGTVVLDAEAMKDGTLDSRGYDRAAMLVLDLQDDPRLWDMSMPPDAVEYRMFTIPSRVPRG